MLKQANAVKRITASGGGSLTANSGESFRIKRVECVPSANDDYLTLKVERVTVGFYRINGKSGNHLGTINGAYLRRNLMDWLMQQGIDVSIPVAEGQEFSVSRYAETGNVIIVYDIYDAGDIQADMPNGSDAKEYTFINYLDIGTALTAAGDGLLDTSLSPSEFPAFPAGVSVPAKTTIDLLALVGSPFVMGEAGPASFGTTFLKLIKDREVLFDEDRNGIPFNGEDATATANAYVANFSLIGSFTEILLNTNAITAGDPMLLDPALRFESGEELNMYLTCSVEGSPTWQADVVDMAGVLKVMKE